MFFPLVSTYEAEIAVSRFESSIVNRLVRLEVNTDCIEFSKFRRESGVVRSTGFSRNSYWPAYQFPALKPIPPKGGTTNRSTMNLIGNKKGRLLGRPFSCYLVVLNSTYRRRTFAMMPTTPIRSKIMLLGSGMSLLS